MRKSYAKEWLGIPCKKFTQISSERFVDAFFFKSFYREFLSRYKTWSELPADWVKLKLQIAHFLMMQTKINHNARILSIGCGLGIMEKYLLDQGYRNLEVTEVVDEPLVWLKKEINPQNIHLGVFPACLADSRTYDIIYLAGVECLFLQEELVSFLKEVKLRLKKGGTCFIASWAFETFIHEKIGIIKDAIAYFLEKMHIRHRGQYWGHSRNKSDFYDAMQGCGFTRIESGCLKKVKYRQTFWIEGING